MSNAFNFLGMLFSSTFIISQFVSGLVSGRVTV